MLEAVVFYILASIIIGMGLLVITRTNPIASALAMVGAFAALAALYATLEATFVAILQILVYAGGIMVLMIFVIMLLNLHTDDLKPMKANGATLLLSLAGVFGGIVVPVLFIALPKGTDKVFPGTTMEGDIVSVGGMLFSNYLFPFEMLSLVLLAAVVGALVLAKRKL
ncbi:MAG TPA: NADH-quinone oxidoreductase subunit J [bacterium]|nr:NADH-quinone oxidoreductase subunit J [bacterium]